MSWVLPDAASHKVRWACRNAPQDEKLYFTLAGPESTSSFSSGKQPRTTHRVRGSCPSEQMAYWAGDGASSCAASKTKEKHRDWPSQAKNWWWLRHSHSRNGLDREEREILPKGRSCEQGLVIHSCGRRSGPTGEWTQAPGEWPVAWPTGPGPRKKV